METSFDNERPIFLQIAESIEDAILTGAFKEESQIPSITEFSVSYKINPATALKGINLLVDGGVLYKKRGVGMFVAKNAKETLLQKRGQGFYEGYVLGLVTEARRLAIGRQQVHTLVDKGFAEAEVSTKAPAQEET